LETKKFKGTGAFLKVPKNAPKNNPQKRFWEIFWEIFGKR
jgi:hypothetical protein